ncbi:efflux RND transporter periplasmic adaptor subunit [Thalassotalea psychrophila]|uniref:Efflux RND transporter periplasmic adaptor subunit n=1 Tax=Thalassotalea psychrophila TaxID=3065647 RepID=A0ABY9TQN3_9GAMM|nr:efflux RND transporter periplasmic adaptor subunit [Colwelliaceae bacterium SQ149]
MKPMKMIKTPLIIIALLSLLACGQQKREKPQVEVVVKSAEQYPYQVRNTFVGRLTASSDVEIQARVKARITKINFKEGSNVELGDVLIELNDKELQAEYKQVKAEVAKSESALKIARKNYNRGQELKPDGYISDSELDALEDKVAESNAAVEAAYAKLDSAEVNLSYTRILAPISGKIDRSKFSVGDLVSPEVGSLTTIVSINTMEVPFQISESTYWKMVRKLQKAHLSKDEMAALKPTILIAFDKTDIYEHQGQIDFVSNRVNPETGSMEVRATIPNPQGILKPGQYVTVIVKSKASVDTLMIPQTAVQSDQQGDYVMTVVEGNKVMRNNVNLGKRVDLLVIVEQGLKLGDVVVVRGVQKIRQGQEVKTKSADQSSQNSSDS